MSYNMSTAYLSDLIYNKAQVNKSTEGTKFIDPLNNTWELKRYYPDESNGYQGAVFVNAQWSLVA